MNYICRNHRNLLFFILLFLGFLPVEKLLAATIIQGGIGCYTGTDYTYTGGGALAATCDDGLVSATVFAAGAVNAPSILSARSTIAFTDLNITGSRYSSQVTVTYSTFLNNWNIVGLAPGEEALMKIDIEISGSVSSSVSSDGSAGSSVRLRASTNRGLFEVNAASNTNAPDFERLQASRTYSIFNGENIFLTLALRTIAGVGDRAGTGRAIADFSNTAGVTGLQVFAMDGVTPLEFSYVPTDNFTLYDPTVVPVPASIWLLSSGLLGLVGIARRKQRA